MSVQDLQNSMEKVAEQADQFAELLARFMQQNADDLGAVRAVLEGTKTPVLDEVRAALQGAATSIEDAKRAMNDAASAARDYAKSI